MFNNWSHIWVLNTRVILGEHCFHLYPNFEGWVSVLFIPEINALQDCFGNLPFHMVEIEITTNRLVFGMVYISVCLHGCGEWVYYGDRTFVLDNICFFLSMHSTHVNVYMEGIINKCIWL